jgi:hypothetical protein
VQFNDGAQQQIEAEESLFHLTALASPAARGSR